MRHRTTCTSEPSTPPPFIRNQTATTYNPGTLASGTTYYWRIDEKDGTHTTTGVVWHFATQSGGTTTFYSDDTKDGWIKESTETSGVGGTCNSTATYLGDTTTKQQYLSVLHFDTSSLPDGATITAATLTIRRLGVYGTPTNLGSYYSRYQERLLRYLFESGCGGFSGRIERN